MTTAPLAVAAGADVLVAGSAIFNDSENVIAAIERLRASIRLLIGKDVVRLAMIRLGRMGAKMVRRLCGCRNHRRHQATGHTEHKPNQCLPMAVPIGVSQLEVIAWRSKSILMTI